MSVDFDPVNNQKLYIQIYTQVLDKIKSGAFQVGDKLPSEKELCKQFNVSRAPVREALCALELNGIVDSIRGGGVYVTSLDFQDGTEEMQIPPHDIIEARTFIEPHLAGLAAINATKENLEELDMIIGTMEQEVNEGVYLPDTDKRFHELIAEASHNEVYKLIMLDLAKAMDQQMWSLIRDRTVTIPEHRQVNFEEHKEIAVAIRAKDQKMATQKMKNHMKHLFNRYWKESF
ncbi:MAG: FadR/GntR family transcriptional regulator [Christensenella sp.]|nr:FadR/GntR family transcriptional regulator [Christensenella sp.]